MDNEIFPRVTPPSLVHRIFLGQQGIRAGWSVGIFIILMALITSALFVPIQFIFRKNGIPLMDDQPLPACVGELIGFLGLLGASMIMAFIEHKPLVSYGLEGTRRPVSFLYGALSGFTALSLLVWVLKLCGVLCFDSKAAFDWNAVSYAFAWGAAFLLVGLYEEYLLRGYLQSTMTRAIGFWWSAILLSAAFGCLHIFNKGESSVGIFTAALAGLIFCISLWYLKQLWWAIGFHASWDWSQSYFWGTADSGKLIQGHFFSVHPQGNIYLSGGTTGPEGSVLAIPLLLLIALLMWIVWRKNTTQQRNNVDAATASL
jgi:uncharacterized protein